MDEHTDRAEREYGRSTHPDGRVRDRTDMAQFALSLERLFAARRRAGEDPQEMEALVGTIAEAWLAEGEARGKAVGIMEGRAAGLAEGKAEAVLRLVRLKFGDIPTDLAAQVRDASSDALDAWLEALITAESIDAVFVHRSAH